MNHLFVSNEVDRHEAEKLLGLTKSQAIAVINKLLEQKKISQDRNRTQHQVPAKVIG